MNKYYILSILVLIAFFVITGCNNQKDESKSATIEKAVKETQANYNIVRKGIIDVAAIDKNKDGKVYECSMDANVISDSPGNCPLCGMKLNEYSIVDTKANLDKNGFKHK